MWKRAVLSLLAAAAVFCGCAARPDRTSAAQQAQEKLAQPYETTARVRYQGIDTTLTIYRKPMNCAVVSFESPDTLQDMQMTFYTDRVNLRYQEMQFDFMPDSLPGQAVSKLILSALDAVMDAQGIDVRQEGEQVILAGTTEQGDFFLALDGKSGNILKLSIPERDLEMEVLNFQLLEG